MLPELLISKFRSRIRSSLQYSPDSEVDFVSGVDTNPRLYLHSRRRYLINSIPLLSIVALLVGFGISIMPSCFGLSFSVFGLLGWFNGECYAVDTSTSLQVATPNLSDTIMPNTTSYLSSEVVYSAENVENYALQISYAEGSNSLKSESDNTTIANTDSNTPGTLAKNTWGYAWGDTNTDNTTLTYQAMPAYGNARTIEQGTADISSTTKKIVFAANLGDDIPTGHYRTNVLLSLVATPKVVIGAQWSNGIDSGIEYMQDIADGFCANNAKIPIPAAKATEVPTITLVDRRDENAYTIAKLQDGNCWMVQNLRLVDKTISYVDSDFTSGTFNIPASNISGFDSSDKYTNKAYLASNTVYYNWYTATAGAGSNSISSAITTSQSICPKQWKLPSGSSSSTYDYTKLFNAIGFEKKTEGGHALIYGEPYNFSRSGRVADGALGSVSAKIGLFWTSTNANIDKAHRIYITDSELDYGSYWYRTDGYAVRCMARY